MSDAPACLQTGAHPDVRVHLPAGAVGTPVAGGGRGTRTLAVTFPAGVPARLTLECDLADAVGFWDPDSRAARTLLPGGEVATWTSLVHSAPTGCLYDRRGDAVGAFALDECTRVVDLRYGVHERRSTFVVHLALNGDRDRATGVGLRTFARGAAGPAPGGRRTLGDVLRELRDWAAQSVRVPPRPVPELALAPVYSTWYAFGQDLRVDDLLAEAALAADLGLGSVFLDDGWQTHPHGGYGDCGDWRPDPVAVGDLAGTVRALHDLRLGVVLWVAPLLLGRHAAAYRDLAPLAPVARPGVAHVLDPRLPAVRAHLTATCLRLVADYGVDGLKLDFLDDAMVYRDAPAGPGAEPDVGVAVQTWLADLDAAFGRAGLATPVVELRQPYVSPALAPYGAVLRAVDCPADTVTNRVSVIDARLACARFVSANGASPGRPAAGQVVHSDMLTWDPLGPPDLPARQLADVFLAVPQVSVRLSRLPSTQRATLAAALTRWQRHRDLVLTGELDPGSPAHRYVAPCVRGDGSLRLLYDPVVVRLTADDCPATVLNLTGEPWVALDLGADLRGAAFEVTALDGDVVAAGILDLSGLRRLDVPPCGELSIRVGRDKGPC